MTDLGAMIVQEETTVRLEMIGQDEMIDLLEMTGLDTKLVLDAPEMTNQDQEEMIVVGKNTEILGMTDLDQEIDATQDMMVAITGMMKIQDVFQDLQGAKDSPTTMPQWIGLR